MSTSCLRKVEAELRMAQKFFAPVSVRQDPEIFCWSFTILMSRSAWLLSKGTAKSVVNRSTSARYR
jgi:hypothetical protein